MCMYMCIYSSMQILRTAGLCRFTAGLEGSFGCRFPHWAFEKNSHAAMLMLRYLLDHKARTHRSLGFLGVFLCNGEKTVSPNMENPFGTKKHVDVSGCCWRFGSSTNGSRDHHHHHHHFPFSNTHIFWIIMY